MPLEDNCRAKVLEHIQLMILTVTIRGLGRAFDSTIDEFHLTSMAIKDGLDLSNLYDFKQYNIVPAYDSIL